LSEKLNHLHKICQLCDICSCLINYIHVFILNVTVYINSVRYGDFYMQGIGTRITFHLLNPRATV